MANVQLAVTDDENTQIILSVPGVQGPAGSNLPPSGTTHQLLYKQSNTDYNTAWKLITNDNVDAAAAIAGTKISPNFGSQNVLTTGTSTAASFIPSSSSVPTNGLYLPSANNVAISTNGTGQLFVTPSGFVGIGTASPGAVLEVSGSIRLSSNPGSFRVFGAADSSNTTVVLQAGAASGVGGNIELDRSGDVVYDGTNHRFRDTSGGSERARIDSSGRLLVGTLSAYAVEGFNRHHYFNPSAGDINNHVVIGASGALGFPAVLFTKTRASAANVATTPVQDNDLLGFIGFYGANGTDFSNNAASITARVDGEPFTTGDTTDLPGRLVFSTTAEGASSPTERMRITQAGLVGIGEIAPTHRLSITTASNDDGITLTNSSANGGRVRLNSTGTGGRAYHIISTANGSGFGGGKFIITDNTASDATRFAIDSSGNIGIGTATPGNTLTINGSARIQQASAFAGINIRNDNNSALVTTTSFVDASNNLGTIDGHLFFEHLTSGGSNASIATTPTGDRSVDRRVTRLTVASNGTTTLNSAVSTAPFVAQINGAEVTRIDSSGRLLVGTYSVTANNALVVVQGRSDSVTAGGSLLIAKGPGDPAGGGALGDIRFSGNNHLSSAMIAANRDGETWTEGVSQPSRLAFSTTANGASSPAERMRITSTGAILVAKISDDINTQGIRFSSVGVGSFSRDADVPLFVNRNTSDGGLVVFRQDGFDEGGISISGTTVSYNGAHLSRWSQLPSGQDRTEILRGTVLSNIDEMCEWGEEGNEQLNRMKVSDVEGDKNVSGVFQAWDDDDDTYTNDFYCAMTGDFIIRIGAGVTIERGDLLMSAGDGTARPQDDDIIRSKTVAKVTSTNVTCTYDDGSYCVPCVLMAC